MLPYFLLLIFKVKGARPFAFILKWRFEDGEVAFPEGNQKLRRAFLRACEKAGIPYGLADGIVMHTLRHSSASYLAKPRCASTRHSIADSTLDLTHMLMRYTHPSAKEVRSALDKLSERGLPLSSPSKKRA